MLYEDQAAGFDERVAIPAETVESMAATVVEMAGLQQGDTLLEIGPGTGLLSLPLIRRSIRYVGFDRSPAMLAVFREKVIVIEPVQIGQRHIAQHDSFSL